jgi:hypothetical protein
MVAPNSPKHTSVSANRPESWFQLRGYRLTVSIGWEPEFSPESRLRDLRRLKREGCCNDRAHSGTMMCCRVQECDL